MKSLDHPITLRMVTGCLDPGDTKNQTDLQPNGGRELSTPIGGNKSWDSKPCNPGRDELPGTGFGNDGGEGDSLWPPEGPVDHGEDIT